MIFSVPELIAFSVRGYDLLPGTIILTGRRRASVWRGPRRASCNPAIRLSVEIEGIGRWRTQWFDVSCSSSGHPELLQDTSHPELSSLNTRLSDQEKRDSLKFGTAVIRVWRARERAAARGCHKDARYFVICSCPRTVSSSLTTAPICGGTSRCPRENHCC
jgi:hypothetical protein